MLSNLCIFPLNVYGVINLALLGYWVNKSFFSRNHEDDNRGENTVGPLSGPELQWGFKYSLALVKILDTPGKSVKKQDPVMKVFSSVQFSRSVVSDSLRPHESQHARPPCPSPTPGVHSNSHPSSRWCHPSISSSCRPLLLLPPIPPSIRVFSNESTLCMRWPKFWNFSFSIIPSKEIPGLISFRMDWLHLLAVQGTLKSLLQHHSSKASILRHSAFFTVQLSQPYMTTGKTIALTRWTLMAK